MNLLERFADWLNPIAVKELRQAVRGRFVAVAVILSLFGQLLAVAFIAASTTIMSPTGGAQAGGPTSFMALYSVLFTICIFLIPAYSGFRMAAERADANIDLLFITTIRPRTIVIGKLIAILALVVLLFSASLPFLVFSYVLRGVDLISIVVLLFVAFITVITQSVLALFIGCLPASKPFKILLAAIFFLFTFGTFPPLLGFASRTLRLGFGGMSMFSMWSELLTVVGMLLVIDAILLIVATAMLTPPVANRALPIRVTIAAVWAVTFAGAALSTGRLLNLWATGSLVLISMVLLSAIGEREAWAPRVARTIPTHSLRRAIAFLFYSGAGGGIVWSLVFYAATILLYIPKASANITRALIDGALCMLAYSLTAALIRRKFIPRVPPRATWAIGLVLFLFLAIVPALIAFLMDAESMRFSSYVQIATMFNPFPTSMRSEFGKNLRTSMLLVWALVELALNAPWIVRQFARFRRYEPQAAADVDWASPLHLQARPE